MCVHSLFEEDINRMQAEPPPDLGKISQTVIMRGFG